MKATVSPTNTPPASAPAGFAGPIIVQDFFISIVAPDATEEPSAAEYVTIVDRMTEYFQLLLSSQIKENYGVDLLSIELSNDFNLFNASIPVDRFNIYMNFDAATFTYPVDSVGVPDANEAFVLLRDSISIDFILEVLRVPGTTFASSNEVVFRESEFDGPP
jgi:hypothetical protein